MKTSILIAVIMLGFAGCSKGPDTAEVEDAAELEAAGVPTQDNPVVQQDLDAVNQALAAKNYEEALKKIAVLKEVPKSVNEQEQFRQTVTHASDTLYQQGQSDPQAMERYRQLGRITMGR